VWMRPKKRHVGCHKSQTSFVRIAGLLARELRDLAVVTARCKIRILSPCWQRNFLTCASGRSTCDESGHAGRVKDLRCMLR